MFPEMVPAASCQESGSIRMPGFESISFGMECMLLGRTAGAGHYENLHAAVAVAAEGELFTIGRIGRIIVHRRTVRDSFHGSPSTRNGPDVATPRKYKLATVR